MWYDYFDSIIGIIYVVMDEKGVVKIELFQDGWEEYHNLNKGSLEHNKERCLRTITQLKEYFNGERGDFNLPLSIRTTEFRNKVWQELINIPYGETRSYSDIAIAIGNPKGVRAIGGANRANEFPIIIPCHRVIGIYLKKLINLPVINNCIFTQNRLKDIFSLFFILNKTVSHFCVRFFARRIYMKKLFLYGIIVLTILVTFISNTKEVFADDIEENNEGNYNITMKQDILTLMMAYPESITGVEKSEEGKVFIITASGKKILYDDKQSKDFNGKMDNADLQDILEDIYPLTMPDKLLDINRDPGRFRNYNLLNEVYGGSEREVSSNLISVPAPYKNYQFNKNNGAAESLKKAMEELKQLSLGNGAVSSLLNPINGTFNYRVISGTGKLSPHAYGIAIDINSNPSDYWKWASRDAGEKRMLSYPKELVDTFEKNNFVWGGKWGHFDILHFEYRPEVLVKAKYFGETFNKDMDWFGEVPRDKKIDNYINIIEGTLN